MESGQMSNETGLNFAVQTSIDRASEDILVVYTPSWEVPVGACVGLKGLNVRGPRGVAMTSQGPDLGHRPLKIVALGRSGIRVQRPQSRHKLQTIVSTSSKL
jgi:hypothetical protein